MLQRAHQCYGASTFYSISLGVNCHFLQDYIEWIKENHQRWPHLTITTSMPSFLNPVKHRGKRYTAEEKANKRTQFDRTEAEWNREIASVRWVNEVAVGVTGEPITAGPIFEVCQQREKH
jgi:hypothetical protein